MVEDESVQGFATRIMPRVIKAFFYIVISYIPIYLLTIFINPFNSVIPWFDPLIDLYTVVFMILLVAEVFASGTIYRHVLGVARAITTMIFFVSASNGGVLALTLPFGEMKVHFTIDLTMILVMLISLSLLGIGKNVVEALALSSNKIEARNE